LNIWDNAPYPSSGIGRNYTPLREVVHCALPGASCGQRMISVDFQSAPIITGEVALPLRWLCQLPFCELATRNLLTLPAILSLASFEILAEILPAILEMWYIRKKI